MALVGGVVAVSCSVFRTYNMTWIDACAQSKGFPTFSLEVAVAQSADVNTQPWLLLRSAQNHGGSECNGETISNSISKAHRPPQVPQQRR